MSSYDPFYYLILLTLFCIDCKDNSLERGKFFSIRKVITYQGKKIAKHPSPCDELNQIARPHLELGLNV